jgi:hypothetical protein
MNGKPDDFDPEIAALFDEASETALDGTAFIEGVLRSVQRERHRHVIRCLGGTLMALTAGAFAAPFVAARTLNAFDWLTRNAAGTEFGLALPVAYALAALISWRIARRRYH